MRRFIDAIRTNGIYDSINKRISFLLGLSRSLSLVGESPDFALSKVSGFGQAPFAQGKCSPADCKIPLSKV